MLFTILKFVHLLSLLLLIASSITKNFLVRKASVPAYVIHKCRVADRVSGATAGLMIASGNNGLFWLKIALLIVTSIFIIRTKIFFRNSTSSQLNSEIKVPSSIKGILAFDLLSLFAMAALGVLIVSGTVVQF
jgi:uncharacterized membrane protein